MADALKEKYLEKVTKNVTQRKKLGEILVERGLLSAEQAEAAAKRAEQRKVLLGTLLVEEQLVQPDALAHAIAEQHGLDYIDLANKKIDTSLLRDFPEHLIKKFHIIPVKRTIKGWTVAVSDPRLLQQNDLAAAAIPKPYTLVVGCKTEIDRMVERNFDAGREVIEQLARQIVLQPSASDSSAIDALVEKILADAIRKNASDIHVDPADGYLRVRERVDGTLRDSFDLDPAIQSTLISKLKVLAQLDITEKRKPQDGRFKFKLTDLSVDVRMSTLPTIRGERVVLRLLNKSRSHITMEKIGFSPEMIRQISEVLEIPHGIILVTGPTGSGKTTTVYSMLSEINSAERNIITVEDPVEYQFDIINQVQIQPKAGLTFPEVLRNILRQDPDVIMVGEVRDRETADLAIRAALTGHLVLSTIHTNDALSTISRLVDMGIERFLIASSINAIISQRLIRLLCVHCTKDGKAVGCDQCNDTGYLGRTVVAEVLIPDDFLKEAISNGLSLVQMQKHLSTLGFRKMSDHGLEKVQAGVTTLEELKRSTS